MIGLQDLIDRLVSGNLINSRAWDDIEVIAGSVLIRDWPVEDCLRLTDYILADRETVRVAGRFCNRVNRTALVEGHTWGMFPRPIPFFVGPAEREIHFPAEE